MGAESVRENCLRARRVHRRQSSTRRRLRPHGNAVCGRRTAGPRSRAWPEKKDGFRQSRDPSPARRVRIVGRRPRTAFADSWRPETPRLTMDPGVMEVRHERAAVPSLACPSAFDPAAAPQPSAADLQDPPPCDRRIRLGVARSPGHVFHEHAGRDRCANTERCRRATDGHGNGHRTAHLHDHLGVEPEPYDPRLQPRSRRLRTRLVHRQRTAARR